MKEPSAPASQPDIPAFPPDEVLAEVALAAERVDELGALGRSFHFERDAESGTVTAELRYLDTGAARAIPLGSVLDVMSGDALPV